ncbi:hypothetical protein C8F04DRAFT_1188186 [Mycena alexandri]|uniref:Uncharacterized protein n=1 Tax=Mycena alexandri TaxID=1745969 RepID=A0AAD6WVI5_9AGAR|nr:hypothetical protein C8F04DRAFT_1188186 [Mycena alexandri]
MPVNDIQHSEPRTKGGELASHARDTTQIFSTESRSITERWIEKEGEGENAATENYTAFLNFLTLEVAVDKPKDGRQREQGASSEAASAAALRDSRVLRVPGKEREAKVFRRR